MNSAHIMPRFKDYAVTEMFFLNKRIKCHGSLPGVVCVVECYPQDFSNIN